MINKSFTYTGERFADIQMLRYRLTGFSSLSLRQKLYIYYLSEATLCGRDITFAQFGKYNLDIRKILEKIYLNYTLDRTDAEFLALEEYLKRVWFSSGIYHHYGCEKFTPGFSEEFFIKAASSVGIDKIDDSILRTIFNPSVEPMRVNQKNGDDLVATSACTYYSGVTQKEAEEFYTHKKDEYAEQRNCEADEYPSFGLNTTLYKDEHGLHEKVWRVGEMYGKAIECIVSNLNKASEYAENEQQKKVISLLVGYYKSGDLKLFDDYSIEWLKELNGRVDFVNGFIEVYGDPIGIKASWEGIVEYKDLEATARTQKICSNAQWFEDNSPVDPRFRKPVVNGVIANVVLAAMLGGDEYPASAIGINLPNADWIRARYGSKSVTIGNLIEAYNEAAKGNGFRDEFIGDESMIAIIDKYDDMYDSLHTDLHECLGHGSGQILPGVDAGALRSYGSTIEEARADLFGLYYIADHKLVELGLLPDDEAYKSQYYTYMLNGLLTQLVRIKPGAQIEEAHMRNRAIIARWVMAHSNGNVRLEKTNGKTYLKIDDLASLRSLFAQLLAEVQRIKSEGDFEVARQLVEEYGITIDSALHEEILERYTKLDIAPYKGFVNPMLKLVFDNEGTIIDVEEDYSESYTEQMLRYSKEYSYL